MTCITYFTDYYQRPTSKAGLLNLEQTSLICSQQLPAPYERLIEGLSKTNYERMTGQTTILLTINYCLTLTADGSKRTNEITSLHSQEHHSLTDRRPITSRLN